MINKTYAVPLDEFVEELLMFTMDVEKNLCPPVKRCPLIAVTSFAEYTCERCWVDYIKGEAQDADN